MVAAIRCRVAHRRSAPAGAIRPKPVLPSTTAEIDGRPPNAVSLVRRYAERASTDMACMRRPALARNGRRLRTGRSENGAASQMKPGSHTIGVFRSSVAQDGPSRSSGGLRRYSGAAFTTRDSPPAPGKISGADHDDLLAKKAGRDSQDLAEAMTLDREHTITASRRTSAVPADRRTMASPTLERSTPGRVPRRPLVHVAGGRADLPTI